MNPVVEITGNLKASTFRKIRQLVYDASGISLSEGKESLVKARIAKRMRVLDMSDYDQYLAHIMGDHTGMEAQHLLDAISTNTTSFYREADHFFFIREAVRQWMETGRKNLRIWCAASSTGEEPYTLGIELKEVIGSAPVTAKILATDISTKVLRFAQKGSYPEERVKPVPKHLRAKYFVKSKRDGGIIYDIRDDLRQMVMFRQYNLSSQPCPIKPGLDLILCRNVMIYFDSHLRNRLTVEFERLLQRGGYLLVGHAESLAGAAAGLKRIRPSIYEKV